MELRERVAEKIAGWFVQKMTTGLPGALSLADAILSLIAADKARGPDPLLEQAREALFHVKSSAHMAPKTECIVDAALAALDARLGGKA